jgi:hypothetical protein
MLQKKITLSGHFIDSIEGIGQQLIPQAFVAFQSKTL